MPNNKELSNSEEEKPNYGSERLPGEMTKHFFYYTMYRDLGINRSISKLVEKLKERGVTISIPRLNKIRGRYSWNTRASIWDGEQDALFRKERDVAAVEMIRRQTRIAVKMQEKGEAKIDMIRPEVLLPKEAIEMVDKGSRIERETFGSPRDNVIVNTQVNINTDELGDLFSTVKQTKTINVKVKKEEDDGRKDENAD